MGHHRAGGGVIPHAWVPEQATRLRQRQGQTPSQPRRQPPHPPAGGAGGSSKTRTAPRRAAASDRGAAAPARRTRPPAPSPHSHPLPACLHTPPARPHTPDLPPQAARRRLWTARTTPPGIVSPAPPPSPPVPRAAQRVWRSAGRAPASHEPRLQLCQRRLRAGLHPPQRQRALAVQAGGRVPGGARDLRGRRRGLGPPRRPR